MFGFGGGGQTRGGGGRKPAAASWQPVPQHHRPQHHRLHGPPQGLPFHGQPHHGLLHHPGAMPHHGHPGWQPVAQPGLQKHGKSQNVLAGWGCSCPLFCSICCACWLFLTYLSLIPFVQWASYGLLYAGDGYHNKGPCTEFIFKSFDGGDLTGLRCHSGAQKVPEQQRAAIVFGGNAMDMYDSAQHMPMMLPAGESWQVFSMSMPGRQYAGGREVPTSPDEAIEEALALLAHVNAETGQPAAIFGWSLGSSLAAGLAAHADQDHIACLLLGNPFSSFRELAVRLTMGAVAPYWYFLDEWTTAEWTARVTSPTLVFSSLRDSLIPVEMHTEVYERSAAPKKMLIERQAGHMSFRPFMDAGDSVLDLCSAKLAPQPSPQP